MLSISSNHASVGNPQRFKNLSKCRSVPSPTPTGAPTSLSTNVTFTLRLRAKNAALNHALVPPPTITISFTSLNIIQSLQ